MRIEYTLRYDATPDEVFAMLSQTPFREKVCKAQDAFECDVKITGGDDSMSVVVDQKRPSEGIPSFARKFVGDTIHVRQQEEWSSRTDAALDVSIPGKPGHLKGTITLRPDDSKGGAGTVQTINGDLKVSIPMVGGKIEVLIAELLEQALQAEERVGRSWLSEKG